MTMKTMIQVLAMVVAAGTILCAGAGEPVQPKPAPASKELERLKSLAGKWHGKVDMGQGPIDMDVQYRVIAGGTVVEERCFVGTPNEMVTMFFDKEGKLALTHYCIMGNRPAMVLKSADQNSIRFAFDENCGINPSKEPHMHALTLRFDDANTITASCKAIINGAEMAEKPTTLKRVL
jgi:hypothetical protein